jgi:hypothetical protein
MFVQAEESNNVATNKEMHTKASLASNALLTIETFSKSREKFQALRGHVIVVCYDVAGRAIWLSQDYQCTTRCGTWDACASSGTDVWIEDFPDQVGNYTTHLDIVHSDEGLGDARKTFITAINQSAEIAEEIKKIRDKLS